ncbi:MAG: hypothetical protein RLN71_00045, partial [Hyphomonas sp.]
AAFHTLFQERGLPDAIRSDNGVPFASPNGLYNLSKLSVWWLRLGIAREYNTEVFHSQNYLRQTGARSRSRLKAIRPQDLNPRCIQDADMLIEQFVEFQQDIPDR